jgi:hypothetical protein
LTSSPSFGHALLGGARPKSAITPPLGGDLILGAVPSSLAIGDFSLTTHLNVEGQWRTEIGWPIFHTGQAHNGATSRSGTS